MSPALQLGLQQGGLAFIEAIRGFFGWQTAKDTKPPTYNSYHYYQTSAGFDASLIFWIILGLFGFGIFWVLFGNRNDKAKSKKDKG